MFIHTHRHSGVGTHAHNGGIRVVPFAPTWSLCVTFYICIGTCTHRHSRGVSARSGSGLHQSWFHQGMDIPKHQHRTNSTFALAVAWQFLWTHCYSLRAPTAQLLRKKERNVRGNGSFGLRSNSPGRGFFLLQHPGDSSPVPSQMSSVTKVQINLKYFEFGVGE